MRQDLHMALLGTLVVGPVLFSAGVGETAPAAPAPDAATRPLPSRGGLAELKGLDRAGVFTALGSFDDRGLSEEEFIWGTAALLDPRRVPGLAAARASGDTRKALEAVFHACRGDRPLPEKPKVKPEGIAAANEVLEHRFSFYDETYQLPKHMDWDFNPGTAHWAHDLNRFQYLETLTRAYLATGDTRYSRKAVALILDWIAKCDTAKCFASTPYVWGSFLNQSIHCQRWCQCLVALIPSDQVTPLELLRILKSLHDQLAYLEIVNVFHRGNTAITACNGILATVAAFPVLRDTDRFIDYSLRTLKMHVADQVLPDGAQHELTPGYHRVVVMNLLSAVRALRALGRELDPESLDALRRMVHYWQQTTTPDGKQVVAFNDSDPEWPGESYPPLADVGLQHFLSPPERLGPEVFPNAGVALLRQRQDQGDLYLAFDAGPFGRAHQHEDKLGFWLFAYGRSLLIDPGRFRYDWSPGSYRPYMTSTAAHSTIRVDGQEQNTRSQPRESWIPKDALDLGWRAREGELRASGVYDLGYGPENQVKAIHRREIVFVKERCWVVFDVVEGGGEHEIESRFQFAPGRVIVDGATAYTTYDDANLLLRAAPAVPYASTQVLHGQENPRAGWYSASTGKIEPSPTLSLSLRTALPWRAATLLFPYRGRVAPDVAFSFDGRHATVRHPEVGEVRVECSLP